MHQVLSYETAVRANNVSEYREYVTKRTCVSLVVTIAFFTLISGKFYTANANVKIKYVMKCKINF